MDHKDFEILSELFKNPLDSFEEIGSKVKMSGVSVRSRMLNMHNSGFLQGVYLIPSPMNFRRYPQTFVFKNVDNVVNKMNNICRVSDVTFVWSDHENDTIVTVFCNSEREKLRAIERLSEIMGVSATALFTPSSLLPPNLSSSKLSRIDWKIVEQILMNPRMPVANISRLTKLSRRTVQNHLYRMLSEQQLYPVYIADFTKATGKIFYGAFAIFENSEVLKKLIDLNLKPVWHSNEPLGAQLLGFADSLKDVDLLKKSIDKIDGIVSFSFSIPAGGIFAEKRVLGWIRDEITKWSASTFN